MTIKTYDIFELAKDLKKAGVKDAVIDAQVKFEKSKDEAMLNTLVTKQVLKYEMDYIYIKTVITLGIINVATIGMAVAIISYLK
jgi:hypothetical protein